MEQYSLEVIEVNPAKTPDCSLILLHGLGADGHDFTGVADILRLPQELNIRYIFPHAPVRPVSIGGGIPMRAWFDIYELKAEAHIDHPGLKDADQAVQRLVQQEIARGIPANRIVLAGFSQGGSMALYSGLRHPQKLAGILALSTFFPAERMGPEESLANSKTPIMMTHGHYDQVIPIALGKYSYDSLVKQGYDAIWKTYDIDHHVCPEEIEDVSAWLSKLF